MHAWSVVSVDRARTLSMSKLLLISYIIILATGGIARPCKYWCKTPDWEYYCCPERDEKMEPEKKNPWTSTMAILIPHLWFAALGWPNQGHHSWKEKEKPKKMCPAVRPACPRSYDWWYDPPTVCHNDDNCISSAKCCFDICLNHKTCKPAE